MKSACVACDYDIVGRYGQSVIVMLEKELT